MLFGVYPLFVSYPVWAVCEIAVPALFYIPLFWGMASLDNIQKANLPFG